MTNAKHGRSGKEGSSGRDDATPSTSGGAGAAAVAAFDVRGWSRQAKDVTFELAGSEKYKSLALHAEVKLAEALERCERVCATTRTAAGEERPNKLRTAVACQVCVSFEGKGRWEAACVRVKGRGEGTFAAWRGTGAAGVAVHSAFGPRLTPPSPASALYARMHVHSCPPAPNSQPHPPTPSPSLGLGRRSYWASLLSCAAPSARSWPPSGTSW